MSAKCHAWRAAISAGDTLGQREDVTASSFYFGYGLCNGRIFYAFFIHRHEIFVFPNCDVDFSMRI